jgi:hypothetical protein
MTFAHKMQRAEADDSHVVDFARNPKSQEFWRIPLLKRKRGEAMLSMWRGLTAQVKASGLVEP